MNPSNVTILNEELSRLPEDLRERVAQYITEHLEDIKDDLRWDETFDRTSSKLVEFARNARESIRNGEAEDMDFSKL